MAGGAIADGGQITPALDLLEILLVDTVSQGRHGKRSGKHESANDFLLDQAWTSGPGFFRYCERIAFADQNASAPTVPVGL